MSETSCHSNQLDNAPHAFHWHDKAVWLQSAKNTGWCLLGCVIGDFSAILWFQHYAPDTNPFIVMLVAICCGILTSILLETVILSRQMPFKHAFKTAIGMSLVSMVAMELAMNLVDLWLVGEMRLTWWAIGPMLLAGFLTPWPYNYWRLKRLGKACH